MTIEKWLSNVYYDEYGTHIWNKDEEGDIQKVVKTQKEAEEFQDEVGKFIVEAIREKIEKL